MSTSEGLQWVVWMGDFALLRNLLGRKRDSSWWVICGWIDALLRGFGQVVFANNPISGILITTAFALTAPGTLVAAAGTGFLGLLLSLLLRDTWDNVGNGLTVYNPLLIGSVTYVSAPRAYGDLDGFVVLIIIVGTIFSVYLTRSLSTGRFPCVTVPFNIVEIGILLVLGMHGNFNEYIELPGTNSAGYVEASGAKDGGNVSEGVFNNSGLTNETLTTDLDWGMVFRGVVVSASRVYAVDNVAAGAVIYLGIVVYSPTTALFSLLGALSGCLVAIGLNVPYSAVYAGLWGYNGLLTGAAFGGLFIVMSGQTSAAAFVAIVYTTLFQYVAEPLMAKIGLPVLTVPFVVSTWLFLGLRDSSEGTFPRPLSVTFPEHETYNFRSNRRDTKFYTVGVDDCKDSEIPNSYEKKSSND